MKAQSTCDLLRARWCEPVLSVVDIRVGDDEEAATDPFYRFGPTRFSVIPRSAVGNVSVRFVPDQVRPDGYTPPQSPHTSACVSALPWAHPPSTASRPGAQTWQQQHQRRHLVRKLLRVL